MKNIKSLYSKIKQIPFVKRFIYMREYLNGVCLNPKKLGYFGRNSILEYPCYISNPKTVFLAESARIRDNCKIINGPKENVVIKKYTVIASGVTLITNSHRSTVGIPYSCLCVSHIHDKSAGITIEEDVWVGANATILSGVTIGRGAIVAAGALVTKDVPPYSLVGGVPAKIMAKNFDLEDVMRHEETIYPKEERLPKEYLEELFEKVFADKKTYGTNECLTEEEQQRLDRVMNILMVNI